LVDVEQFAAALRDDTLLASAMLANNEIGVIQPIAELAAICRERGVLFHCDATQAVGKLPVDVEALGVDLMSFTAHKIYGPKGIGALYLRRAGGAVRLEPQITGGGHEGGLRSGTLHVPGIVGFARALELCVEEMPTERRRLATLRQRLYDGLTSSIRGVALNGPALDGLGADGGPLRLPGNLNVSFALVDGEALMMSIGGLAVSSGAACTSANPEPSHVLRALGIGDDLTRSSLRFGIGRSNTAEEIDWAVASLAETVERLRKLSSLAS
jgi:cysteine desulfurase